MSALMVSQAAPVRAKREISAWQHSHSRLNERFAFTTWCSASALATQHGFGSRSLGASAASDVVAHTLGLGFLWRSALLSWPESIRLPPECGVYAICDSCGQHFGPLVDCLIRDTNFFSGSAYGAAKHGNGVFLEHAILNHSSHSYATTVQNTSGTISTMVAFQDRLKAAMAHAGIGRTALAEALGVSYQAVRKALEDPRAKSLSADNTVKAARAMAVNSEWLATGEGEMLATPWPFPRIDRNRIDRLDAEARGYVQKAIIDALTELERGQPSAENKTPINVNSPISSPPPAQNVTQIDLDKSRPGLRKTREQKARDVAHANKTKAGG